VCSIFVTPKIECAHGVDDADHDEANMKRSSTIFSAPRHRDSCFSALGASRRGREQERDALSGVLQFFYCVRVFGLHSIFVALYQAFKVLGYAGQNKIFSPAAVKSLRTIKYCAMTIIGFVAVSVTFMFFTDPDDRPAGIFMRILITFPSIVVVAAATMVERILQNAVEIKSENDLTV
jgi:DUF2975 family protein